ncbi:MAG: outer membrane lipoprotein chaperone LolA [Betaproteobacteria bacterium]
MLKRILLLSMLAMPPAAHAAGIDALKSFINNTDTAQARFAQMVLDRNLKQLQQASGTMQFSRPGKFRWVYNKPYEQVIVGDGTQLWIYDKDLNQVTVRRLDRALGSSPAALLAGKDVLEENYTLNDIGSQEGLEWVEAIPKTQDTAFERVRIGFGKSGLEAMELRDQFGQITVIKFADLQRNPKLPPDTFKFTPPAGADIIRE